MRTSRPVPIKEGRRMEMYFALSPKLELLTAYEKAFGEPPRSFPTSRLFRPAPYHPEVYPS